jgi:hypothetical protein
MKPVRPIKIDGDVAYVPLTQGYVAVIDAADVPIVDGRNWRAMVNKTNVYAVRGEKPVDGAPPVTILMHRVLTDAPKGLEVDHKDCDGINNRRCNLRIATRSQNQHNQRLRHSNLVGFKGVSWHKASAKWQAIICIDSKNHWLGLHDTPEDAHGAYCEASKKLHGDFGRTE